MRLTQIEKMLQDHEKRLKALEPVEKIEPINTEKGVKQRDEAREKIDKKAKKEEKKDFKEEIVKDNEKINESYDKQDSIKSEEVKEHDRNKNTGRSFGG